MRDAVVLIPLVGRDKGRYSKLQILDAVLAGPLFGRTVRVAPNYAKYVRGAWHIPRPSRFLLLGRESLPCRRPRCIGWVGRFGVAPPLEDR